VPAERSTAANALGAIARRSGFPVTRPPTDCAGEFQTQTGSRIMDFRIGRFIIIAGPTGAAIAFINKAASP
jgi:hypothetical protein